MSTVEDRCEQQVCTSVASCFLSNVENDLRRGDVARLDVEHSTVFGRDAQGLAKFVASLFQMAA